MIDIVRIPLPLFIGRIDILKKSLKRGSRFSAKIWGEVIHAGGCV